MQIRTKGVGKDSRDLLYEFWDPLHISETVRGNYKIQIWYADAKCQ